MQSINEMTPVELQRRGIEALTKDLGIAGTVHFLQLFDKGSGDWTKERQEILKNISIESIVNEISENELNLIKP